MTIASAPSKVNLILRVGAADSSGYHGLATVFQALSLREYVEASMVGAAGSSLDRIGTPSVRTYIYEQTRGSHPRLSAQRTESFAELDSAEHLAVRAAAALGAGGNVHLDVHKTIPVAGGMAGGSADAAAALVAVNDLLGGRRNLAELQEIGRSLGADVPACLVGGLALGLGRGDQMEVLRGGTTHPNEDSSWWVLVLSKRGLSTPSVFNRFDKMSQQSAGAPAISAMDLLDLRRAGASQSVAGLLVNELAPAAIDLRPDLQVVGESLRRHGTQAWLVSGSGPTVAGLASSQEEALRIAAAVEAEDLPEVREVAVAWGPTQGATIESRLPSWTV